MTLPTSFVAACSVLAALGLGLRWLWPRLLADPTQAQYGQVMVVSLVMVAGGAWILAYGVVHSQGTRVVAGVAVIAIGIGVFVSVALMLRWYRRTQTSRRVDRLTLMPEYPVRLRTGPNSFLVEIGFRDARSVGVIYQRDTRTIGGVIDLDAQMPTSDWLGGALTSSDQRSVGRDAARLFFKSYGGRRLS